MRKFLTPCNIAIVIALGCFSYIIVQRHYDRQATEELYKTVLDLNSQAMDTARTATAILGQIKPSMEIPNIEVQEPQITKQSFKPKKISLRKPKPNPCSEVIRAERIGNWEVRHKDLKCLNAANYEEQ